MTLRYRACHNCHMSTYTGWPYCDDCLRMARRTAVSLGLIAAGILIVAWAVSLP